jgi:hypothetical protein
MPAKQMKKVCKCESCGNEAEMMITCSLEADDRPAPEDVRTLPSDQKQQMKGHGVCTHCGNEADIWVDI